MSFSLYCIYGGTFDPIHLGHVVPVIEACEQLGVKQLHLLPCHIPPHKEAPGIDTQHRVEMIKLVCQHQPLFHLDSRELNRQSHSYSVETLREIRAQKPNVTILFFIGMDSLASLHKWYRWKEVLNYCHLVVCARPGYDLDSEKLNPELEHYLEERICDDKNQLFKSPSGQVFVAKTSQIPVSSTEIRTKLASGEDVTDLIPDYVLSYIKQHQLYL